MNAGRETKMLRGAIWACAIPMALGFLSLIFVASNPNYYGVGNLSVYMISFLVVAPLAAGLACRRLKRIADTTHLSLWRTSFFAGLGAASFLQFIIASILIGLFFVISGEMRDVGEWGYLLGFGLIANCFIWLSSTLPLSLICATIFWRATNFPEDRNVF